MLAGGGRETMIQFVVALDSLKRMLVASVSLVAWSNMKIQCRTTGKSLTTFFTTRVAINSVMS